MLGTGKWEGFSWAAPRRVGLLYYVLRRTKDWTTYQQVDCSSERKNVTRVFLVSVRALCSCVIQLLVQIRVDVGRAGSFHNEFGLIIVSWYLKPIFGRCVFPKALIETAHLPVRIPEPAEILLHFDKVLCPPFNFLAHSLNERSLYQTYCL